MLISILKPNFIHNDDRGTLTQLVREGYHQVNVIESKPGSERGGHYHKQNSEAFFVVEGSFRLRLTKDEASEVYEFRKGDMFAIHALVSHSFEFLERTILVSMYDNGVELPNGEKDIYQE